MKIKTIKSLTCQAILASLALTATSAQALTVTSSTNDGNGPENTIDNNLDTRWSASGDGEYLQYDLGETLNIDSLDIAFYKGDQRTATFDVLTSEDGSTWATVFSGDQSSSTTDQFNVALESSIGQYVKVVGYGNTSNSWNSITEVDINTSIIPDVDEGDDSDNGDGGDIVITPIEYTASTSYESDNGSAHVIDEDLSTRWSANGDGEWVQVDLGSLQTLSAVNLAFYKGDSRTATFDIEVSSDGENFTTILSTVSSSGESTELEAFSLNDVSAQYVRYVGYGNSSNTWNSVTEMNVTASTVVDGGDDNGDNDDTGTLDWDMSIWDLEGGDYDLDPVVGDSMVFDALAAQHVTPNGNGWRHELKIDSDRRVAMTEVYENFQANIKLDISTGSKMIVAQHHASDTGTIVKLYVSDSSESGFDDSEANNGIFDVYVRMAKEDGSGEEKFTLGTVESGDDFDFQIINNYGYVTVRSSINGEDTEHSLAIEDSSESYLKFGNYLQAQDAESGDDVDDSDDWEAFYEDAGITESKLTFTNLSYVRLFDGETDGAEDGTDNGDDSSDNNGDDDNTDNGDDSTDDNTDDTVDNGDNGDDDVVVDCTIDDTCPEQGGDFVGNGTITYTSPGDLSDTLASATAGDEIIVTGSTDEISIKNISFDTPVLVRAESIGGTTLTSIALTSSNNIIFSGFVFGPNSDASTLFKITDSTNIGVLRSVFDHKDVEVGQNSIIMAGTSQYIEIAYNTFRDKNVTHRDGGKNTGSFIKYQYEASAGMTKDTHVHHNLFSNIPAYVAEGNTTPEGDSDREAIVMGIADSQDEVTNNLVEYNLFDNCDGENEIITVKTSGNEFSNNTFVNSMGSLSFRLGHDNIAHSNQFYGSGDSEVWTDENYQTGGIRVYGADHSVYNNYMEGLSGTTWRLPLLLDNGDSSDTFGNDNHQNVTNVNVYNNTIVNSNGGVHIGRADSKYGNSPTNNFITDNTVVGSQGLLFENDADSSTNSWSGNKVYATGSATAASGGSLSDSALEILSSEPSITAPTPLTTSDVGPTAP